MNLRIKQFRIIIKLNQYINKDLEYLETIFHQNNIDIYSL